MKLAFGPLEENITMPNSLSSNKVRSTENKPQVTSRGSNEISPSYKTLTRSLSHLFRPIHFFIRNFYRLANDRKKVS